MPSEASRPIQYKDYKSLRLDQKKNPRLPERLVNATETEILDYMVTKGGVADLMRSIGEKGYFEGEPLLGVEEGNDGKIIIVEGNRRLSAVMLLNDHTLSTRKRSTLAKIVDEADHIPDKLPVIVFPERGYILDYLGYRHITGIKSWDTLAKAKYLKLLWDDSTISDDRSKSAKIAKTIGSRADYVRKLLCALGVYEIIQDNNFFGIEGIEQSVSDSFSYVTTALGYTKIQEFLGLESGEEIDVSSIETAKLRKFTQWMFDKSDGTTRLGESRNIHQLAMVVANPKALKEFEKGTDLESAYQVAGGAEETVNNSIAAAYKKMELAHRYSAFVDSTSDIDLERLNDIIRLAKSITKQLQTDDD